MDKLYIMDYMKIIIIKNKNVIVQMILLNKIILFLNMIKLIQMIYIL